jgi:hypothetical protein
VSRDTPWPGTPVLADDFPHYWPLWACFCNSSKGVLLRITTLFVTDTRPFTTDKFLGGGGGGGVVERKDEGDRRWTK